MSLRMLGLYVRGAASKGRLNLCLALWLLLSLGPVTCPGRETRGLSSRDIDMTSNASIHLYLYPEPDKQICVHMNGYEFESCSESPMRILV